MTAVISKSSCFMYINVTTSIQTSKPTTHVSAVILIMSIILLKRMSAVNRSLQEDIKLAAEGV